MFSVPVLCFSHPQYGTGEQEGTASSAPGVSPVLGEGWSLPKSPRLLIVGRALNLAQLPRLGGTHWGLSTSRPLGCCGHAGLWEAAGPTSLAGEDFFPWGMGAVFWQLAQTSARAAAALLPVLGLRLSHGSWWS